ncbi:arsenate-mycothiol transferase ArsC [Salinimicrobium gaetbulicola]|uniref:Low molecular weight phosphatase family protein n=1 Tax=Salinimicrobium gaetbulicola TaxID=999702 RepID=A0ABW3IEH9_9FLAO
MPVFKEISNYISGLKPENIPPARKEVLQPLVDYIQKKSEKNEEIRLNFICTHNSRRSHLSQVWAQALAHHFQLKNVVCYSGGTEATAIYPMTVETLKKTGFQVRNLSEGKNPVYGLKYSANSHPVIGFSKKIEDAFNPKSHFAAVMTCSEADAGCPFVPGAETRIPLTYEDPKQFDDSPEQAQKYLERGEQIATELYYIFSQIKP